MNVTAFLLSVWFATSSLCSRALIGKALLAKIAGAIVRLVTMQFTSKVQIFEISVVAIAILKPSFVSIVKTTSTQVR